MVVYKHRNNCNLKSEVICLHASNLKIIFMAVHIFANAVGVSGGASNSILDVIEAISSSGEKIILYTRTIKMAKQALAKHSLKVHQIKYVPFRFSERKEYKNCFLFIAKYLRSRFVHAKWMHKNHIDPNNDIVLTNSFGSHNLYLNFKAAVKKELNSTIIIRGAADELTFTKKNQDLKWGINVLSQYDTLVFLSELLKKDWLCHKQLQFKNAEVIPNCIEEMETSKLLKINKKNIRSGLNLPNDRFIACCLGSIIERKGQDMILKIMDALIKAKPDILVLFVGSVSNWGKKLINQFNERGYQNHVLFTDYSKEALKYLRASDVQVLTSKSEALPRVILESFASKVPIIASINGANEAVIHHKINGCLFQIDKPEEIINNILELNDNELCNKIINNAYKDYWTNYSKEMLVLRYNKLLKDLKNKNKTQAL